MSKGEGATYTHTKYARALRSVDPSARPPQNASLCVLSLRIFCGFPPPPAHFHWPLSGNYQLLGRMREGAGGRSGEREGRPYVVVSHFSHFSSLSLKCWQRGRGAQGSFLDCQKGEGREGGCPEKGGWEWRGTDFRIAVVGRGDIQAATRKKWRIVVATHPLTPRDAFAYNR